MVGEKGGRRNILWRVRVGGASQSDEIGPCLPASVTWGGRCGAELEWVTWAPSCLCPPGDQTPDCFGECGDSIGRGWQAYGVPQVE